VPLFIVRAALACCECERSALLFGLQHVPHHPRIEIGHEVRRVSVAHLHCAKLAFRLSTLQGAHRHVGDFGSLRALLELIWLALDAIDCRIVAELQADARLSNVELAGKVGLLPSPCLPRVKRLLYL
jgi:AsnC-type helix-turn-helix domain